MLLTIYFPHVYRQSNLILSIKQHSTNTNCLQTQHKQRDPIIDGTAKQSTDIKHTFHHTITDSNPQRRSRNGTKYRAESYRTFHAGGVCTNRTLTVTQTKTAVVRGWADRGAKRARAPYVRYAQSHQLHSYGQSQIPFVRTYQG